jgi:hypothetical protein
VGRDIVDITDETLLAGDKVDVVYKARQDSARQRNATSREPKREEERRREESRRVRESKRMREGEKMDLSAEKNRLLNEAVAGIPANRKTTDGGIMGYTGRVWTRGVGLQGSRVESVDFVLKGEEEERKSER